jgi:hypothetical protein
LSSRGFFFRYPKCKNTGEVPAKLLEDLGVNGNGQASGNGNGQMKTHAEPAPIDGEE